ncbi:MAG: FeoA family protein [Desulfomonilaceae bacterium]|nr:FeoA family protein [Desulfomonilaceae bacterium]
MYEDAVRPLNELKPGQKAFVVALMGGRSFQTRLIDMGLNVGSAVELIRTANVRGGGALVAVGETRLAIGSGMAGKILVASD